MGQGKISNKNEHGGQCANGAPKAYHAKSTYIKQHAQMLFTMYQTAGTYSGQSLWFKTVDELLRPQYCYLILCKNSGEITTFIIYETLTYTNKILLSVNDGTEVGKMEVISLLIKCLSEPGWVLEASGKLMWLMGQKQVGIIQEKISIEELIESGAKENIVINTTNSGSKRGQSYHYLHQYLNEDGSSVVSETEVTLFGVGGCVFSSDSCDRKCVRLL
jgi:hypothetical protein